MVWSIEAGSGGFSMAVLTPLQGFDYVNSLKVKEGSECSECLECPRLPLHD